METPARPRCARDKPHADVASSAHLFPARSGASPVRLSCAAQVLTGLDRQPDIPETAVTPGWKDGLLPARLNTWATETHQN